MDVAKTHLRGFEVSKRKKKAKVKNQLKETEKHADLIARLRAQKTELDKWHLEIGFMVGATYACEHATYEEFLYLEKLIQMSEEEHHSNGGEMILRADIVENALEAAQDIWPVDRIVDENRFWIGWLGGVVHIWEEVKPSL